MGKGGTLRKSEGKSFTKPKKKKKRVRSWNLHEEIDWSERWEVEPWRIAIGKSPVERGQYQCVCLIAILVPEFERIFFVLISKVFMTVEIGLLIRYNFFYVYFNGSINDRRNKLIVSFTPTAQDCILLRPWTFEINALK